MSMVFATWNTLLNNFVVEVAQFDGAQIGMLQSLREIPGFLAFTAVFVLLVLREQTMALAALALMCVGVSLTGYFPTEYGLYATTVLMSIGFHYYETINQSLTLQWLPKDQTAEYLGRTLSVKAAGALLAYGAIYAGISWFELSFEWIYLTAGCSGLALLGYLVWKFPRFEGGTVQHKHLLLRKDYWLYYGLTFLSGARRQIFVVFAGFLMVEKFGFSVTDITALFVINYLFNLFCAPAIGRLIKRIGERRALIAEYLGLILVFVGYGVAEEAWQAGTLYVLDHLLFALAIALQSYLQKIADPRDMAATASVSFTINHIAAVIIPAVLGLVWLNDHSLVFYTGASFALASLLLSLAVPSAPSPQQPYLGAVIRPS
nr:MFS transporter [uncultured Ferrimonas sp.]